MEGTLLVVVGSVGAAVPKEGRAFSVPFRWKGGRPSNTIRLLLDAKNRHKSAQDNKCKSANRCALPEKKPIYYIIF